MPAFVRASDERLPIGLAFAASLIVHGWALVMPGWTHPHPVEPPAPLVVALQPAPSSAAAPASRPSEERRESAPPSDPRPPKPAPRAPSEAPRRVAPPPAPSAAPAPAKPPEREIVAARDTAPVAPASPAPPAPAMESGERSAPTSAPETTGRPAVPAATASALASAPATTPPAYGAAYLRNPAPRYPAEARRRGAEGTVMLRVWVAADGSATRVEVDRSSGHQALDEAALAAVKNWRFVPAQRGGAPVEGLVTVPLVFRLDGSG